MSGLKEIVIKKTLRIYSPNILLQVGLKFLFLTTGICLIIYSIAVNIFSDESKKRQLKKLQKILSLILKKDPY